MVALALDVETRRRLYKRYQRFALRAWPLWRGVFKALDDDAGLVGLDESAVKLIAQDSPLRSHSRSESTSSASPGWWQDSYGRMAWPLSSVSLLRKDAPCGQWSIGTWPQLTIHVLLRFLPRRRNVGLPQAWLWQ